MSEKQAKELDIVSIDDMPVCPNCGKETMIATGHIFPHRPRMAWDPKPDTRIEGQCKECAHKCIVSVSENGDRDKMGRFIATSKEWQKMYDDDGFARLGFSRENSWLGK